MDARICPSCSENNNPQLASCWKCHVSLNASGESQVLKPLDMTPTQSQEKLPKKQKDNLGGGWFFLILGGIILFGSLIGEYHRDDGLDAFFRDPFYSYSRFAAACIGLITINLSSVIAFVIGLTVWKRNKTAEKRKAGKLLAIIALILILMGVIRQSLPSEVGDFSRYFRSASIN